MDRFFGTNGIGSGRYRALNAATAASPGGGGPIRDPCNCGGPAGVSAPNRGVGAANGVNPRTGVPLSPSGEGEGEEARSPRALAPSALGVPSPRALASSALGGPKRAAAAWGAAAGVGEAG
ncbi:hypothetical protein GCM10028799_39900 [Kribbella italica]